MGDVGERSMFLDVLAPEPGWINGQTGTRLAASNLHVVFAGKGAHHPVVHIEPGGDGADRQRVTLMQVGEILRCEARSESLQLG